MATLEKIDLFKLHKNEYVTPRKPVLLTTEPAVYLAVSGQGAPGGEVFTAKIGALYAVAFTVKMTRKFGGQQDYAVGKLECQWFFENPQQACQGPSDDWRWKLLMRTPDFVSPKEVGKAIEVLLGKGKPTEVKEVNLEPLSEGLCVQMLHVGPYNQEGQSVHQMQAFAEGKGLHFAGAHHEIYLSDPRRVPPERLKTILRHPVVNGK